MGPHLVWVRAWEGRMMMDSPYHSDVMRGAFAQGFAEGKAEGKAKGKAKAIARSVLLVLQARGIEATDEHRQRIEGCTDQEQLETWLQRAVTAQKADEVFA
ncbi:hypothetical protein [Actinomadura rubrisoli]|uniref:DUF4351 domain-containing protein n=1 Tax=Actinomadura rubrisoli TaxID=2530368 RepID=A0A4R4ZXU4_9ACTN|nr:hypothetical protein [Actinomadura rubrisoli]TDD63825.1 hypothetical protein E1298_43100 [Actinomadura rubrisoli]